MKEVDRREGSKISPMAIRPAARSTKFGSYKAKSVPGDHTQGASSSDLIHHYQHSRPSSDTRHSDSGHLSHHCPYTGACYSRCGIRTAFTSQTRVQITRCCPSHQ